MYSIQRWIKLLVLILVILSVSTWAEEEIHASDGTVETEEAVEEQGDEEPIAEIVETFDEQVEDEVNEIAEEVVESTETMTSTALKATKSLLDNVKNKVSDAVDLIVSESKNVIERCKNMNKADVKKVTAAAVGIWGVAVGVGYLTKGTTPPPPPPSGKSTPFAKKK
jgi:hypothetical protein